MKPSLDDFKSTPGHLYDCEGIYLQSVSKNKSVLEIGSHHGRSTIAMAATCANITTVEHGLGDTFIGRPNLDCLKNNTRKYPHITVLISSWQNAVKQLDLLKFDMIFYDGDHIEEGEFLTLLHDFKGDILVHDFKPHEANFHIVVKAVTEFQELTGRVALFPSGSIAHFKSIA